MNVLEGIDKRQGKARRIYAFTLEHKFNRTVYTIRARAGTWLMSPCTKSHDPTKKPPPIVPHSHLKTRSFNAHIRPLNRQHAPRSISEQKSLFLASNVTIPYLPRPKHGTLISRTCACHASALEVSSYQCWRNLGMRYF